MKRELLLAIAMSSTFAGGAMANTEKYCNTVAQMATEYVGDREARQPYATTLYTIDAAVDQANLSTAERQKWKRDLKASAKIAYVDFPKITEAGIYKLVQLGCMSE
ncbi:hypothetical protein [Rhodoferax sp. GW822-FHT02A01]|uniref:hypothetical protein n=1 Tax=Rhodoferax sp. GW822-FHT02A01 TaxID=3141537 RepID=UPI00315DA2A5